MSMFGELGDVRQTLNQGITQLADLRGENTVIVWPNATPICGGMLDG